MCITKSKMMLVGAIAGGLLFVASASPTHVFAMSDSPSTTTVSSDPSTSTDVPVGTSTTSSNSTGQAAPGSQQPNADLPTLPSAPPQTNSMVASGSTATQNDTSILNSTSSSLNQPDPTTAANAPSSTDSATNNSTQNTNNTNVNNSVTSNAQTGDASVTYSPKGGNSTTGDATATATIVNATTSSISGGLTTFTYDINGNQNGDVLLNLGSLVGGANTTTPTTGPATTDNQNNTTVNNNVNLTATTGNATVANNGIGGNATTGNALTQADIVNILSSLICNNQLFVGTVNINGNLNGNLLLPAGLIDSLLNPQSPSPAGDSTTNSTNNVSVNNDVSLNSRSGTAAEINNGTGGNATSGNATTSLNMYNLVNNNIVGGNVLLVFVNDLGHWYGLLMNSPAGTSAAALGGGITQDTLSPPASTTATNNITVNNIVNLCSTTGDAMVSDNGLAGNATTGNATAVADIANVVNSQINLSGWLGVLIINIFGTWNGSLLAQTTAAPTPIVTVHGSGGHHAVILVGTGANTSSGGGLSYGLLAYKNTNVQTADTQILGAYTANLPDPAAPIVQHDPVINSGTKNNKDFIVGLIAAVIIALIIVLTAARVMASRNKG